MAVKDHQRQRDVPLCQYCRDKNKLISEFTKFLYKETNLGNLHGHGIRTGYTINCYTHIIKRFYSGQNTTSALALITVLSIVFLSLCFAQNFDCGYEGGLNGATITCLV